MDENKNSLQGFENEPDNALQNADEPAEKTASGSEFWRDLPSVEPQDLEEAKVSNSEYHNTAQDETAPISAEKNECAETFTDSDNSAVQNEPQNVADEAQKYNQQFARTQNVAFKAQDSEQNAVQTESNGQSEQNVETVNTAADENPYKQPAANTQNLQGAGNFAGAQTGAFYGQNPQYNGGVQQNGYMYAGQVQQSAGQQNVPVYPKPPKPYYPQNQTGTFNGAQNANVQYGAQQVNTRPVGAYPTNGQPINNQAGNYRPVNNAQPYGTYPQRTNTPVQNGGYAGVNYQNQNGYNPVGNVQNPSVPPQQYARPYYPNNTPPKPKKEKTKNSVWVFILIISIVLSFFVGIFVCAAVYSTRSNNFDDSGHSDSIFEFDDDKKDDNDNDKKDDDISKPSSDSKKSDSDVSTNKDFSLKLEKEPADTKTGNYNSQTAFDKVSPSVVGIRLYKDETTDKVESEGSGIIISSDGYILTNSHVILNTGKYKIQIIGADGEEFSAKVVGYDSRTDLAVLKADKTNLTPAVFGDYSDVKVGQDIVVIGNPGGLDFQNSLTKGIVSATNRTLSSNKQVSYLQTDAAINPGNSGGPVCNLYGQVIAVSTAKISSTEYEGMSFAIPSDKVKAIADDLIKNGYVSDRVRIGISGYEVTDQLVYSYNVPKGVVIEEITKGGPMDNGDVKAEDIITEIDGKDIKSFQDIYSVLSEHKSGDKVKVRLYRVSNSSSKSGYYETTITLDADDGSTQVK